MVEKIKVVICEEAKEANKNNVHKIMEGQHKAKYNNTNIGLFGGVKMEKIGSLVEEKLKGISVTNQPYWRAPRLKRSATVVVAALVLCACIVQLSTLYEAVTQHGLMLRYSRHRVFLRPRVYESNGYLTISSNGGLNQMRAGICDMVAIARHLNATLIVPELDKTSFWNDHSKFEEIFDVEHFITSLKDQVRILKELPEPNHSRLSMAPSSWSNLTFYDSVVLPRLKTYKVVHFTQTDSRLANNGIPLEIQRLRCRTNYEALKFTPQIEEMGKKIVKLLRQNGPFIALHLRYEMDMLAFSGCNEGCNDKEIEELTALRYAYPWWREKEINSEKKRREGGCPITPEEAALALRALDIDPSMQIYIASGDIYGGDKRMALLRLAFPRLVKKETLISPSELKLFRNHSNQMAALDYYVSLQSDIFVPTHKGNMAMLVEGHRRYLGYKPTIILDRGLVVHLVDRYRNGTMKWDKFVEAMKIGHAGQFGTPTPRLEIKGKPKQESYFYGNPYECLPQYTHRS